MGGAEAEVRVCEAVEQAVGDSDPLAEIRAPPELPR